MCTIRRCGYACRLLQFIWNKHLVWIRTAFWMPSQEKPAEEVCQRKWLVTVGRPSWELSVNWKNSSVSWTKRRSSRTQLIEVWSGISKRPVAIEELITAVAGVESLLNSQALTYQPADPRDLAPLVSNYLLHGRLGGQLAPETVNATKFSPRKWWQKLFVKASLVEKVVGLFVSIWD